MPDLWNAVRDVQLSTDPEDPDPFATWEFENVRTQWVYDDPKILVVDDDVDTRHLITLMLEHDGLTSLEAADGEVAMTLAMSECPDLVILDVMMPGLDGYTVCRQLREDLCLHGVPVIMLTGLSGLNDELACIASGADAYLAKPVSRLELMARVRELL